MDKNILIEMMGRKLSTRQMCAELNKSQTTVIYWFKKYGLTNKKIVENNYRVCPKCKIDKYLDEFYNKRGKTGKSSYCKICTNSQTTERSKEFKRQVVDYKGGCCEKCNYNKSLAALEFHHKDPTKKDFGLGGIKLKNLTDEIKKELDKCILVCSNCHREIHEKLNMYL